MTIAKLWLAVLLGALPATAAAQVSAEISVGDTYDSTAPGVPVESVDVFYDQLAPYGVWVDDPTIGHVFIPQEDGFVPYTNGYWQYTSVGFVWIANEPFAAITSHYGRWAYSQPYSRWVWLPDIEWGPSWVEWRESGDDFGWAPLAPEIVVRTGYSPPIESWHYCGAAHVLDTNVTRYYEPRVRVAEIHRAARPMEHYATVSNVRVVVGPPMATLRAHHVEAKPVKVDVRVTGRVASASEAHAQVTRAQERKPQLEVENQKRIQANTHISAVVAKQPAHVAPKPEPTRTETKKPEPAPAHVAPKPEPTRTETKKPEPAPTHVAPKPEPTRTETKKPEPAPTHVAPKPEPTRTETKKPEPAPTHVAPKPEPAPTHVAPKPEPTRTETKKPEPAPTHAAPGDKHEPEHH